jgi:hypothetical protein
MPQMDFSCIGHNMLKMYLKTLESNCNIELFGRLTSYPADRPPLTFSHSHLLVGISSAFQDGSKPFTLEGLLYPVPRTRENGFVCAWFPNIHPHGVT